MSFINGQLHTTNLGAGVPNTSSSSWLIANQGDTMVMMTQRTPASNADGKVGEFCFGVVATIPYLYYCYADNNWARTTMTKAY